MHKFALKFGLNFSANFKPSAQRFLFANYLQIIVS